jgi:hypothetical protein
MNTSFSTSAEVSESGDLAQLARAGEGNPAPPGAGGGGERT